MFQSQRSETQKSASEAVKFRQPFKKDFQFKPILRKRNGTTTDKIERQAP